MLKTTRGRKGPRLNFGVSWGVCQVRQSYLSRHLKWHRNSISDPFCILSSSTLLAHHLPHPPGHSWGSPCLFIVGEGYSHIWAQDTISYQQCLQTLMCTSSTSSVVQGTCLQNRLDALRGTPWSMGYSYLPSTNCHWTRRLSMTPRREVSQVQLEPVLYYSTSLTIRLKFWLGLSGQTVAVLNARNPLLPIFLAIFKLPIQNSITSLDSHLLALLNASKSLLVMPLSYYQSSWLFSSCSYRAPLPNNIPLDSHLLPITVVVTYITHWYSLSMSPQATFHSVNGSGAHALQSTFHMLCKHHWW